MVYLIITQNGEAFQTTDKPELVYKTQIAFGGWTAFQYDITSTQPYSRLVYETGVFFYESVDTLNQ